MLFKRIKRKVKKTKKNIKSLVNLSKKYKWVETTDEQYRLFCQYSRSLQRFLGLNNWEICIVRKDRNREGNRACFDCLDNNYSRLSITFFKQWKLKKDYDFMWKGILDKEIKITALHEMLHALLYELVTEGDEETLRFEHRLINTLTNILLDENGDLKEGFTYKN